MSNIKMNKESLNTSIKELELTSVELSKAVQELHTAVSFARSGFSVIEQDSVEDYSTYIEDVFISYEKMIGYKTQVNALIYNLKGICTILEEFELDHSNKNIDDLIANVSGGNELLQMLRFDVDETGNKMMYFDLDGKKVTVSELVNSFYTYTGASMHANIESRMMSSKVGTSFDEAAQKELLENINGFISGAQNKGYFSLVHMPKVQNLEKELGTTLGSAHTFANYSSENIVGKMIASGVAVGASLVGAYTLTEHLAKEKQYKTREEVSLSIQDMIKSTLQYTDKKERLK